MRRDLAKRVSRLALQSLGGRGRMRFSSLLFGLALLLSSAPTRAQDAEYLVTLTCGSQTIYQVTLGAILPESIDPGVAQLGADHVGQIDCLDGDPTKCENATGVYSAVDKNLSFAIPPNSTVAGRPNTFYFTMVGSGPGNRLCGPGQTVDLFKVVAPVSTPDRLILTAEALDAVSDEVCPEPPAPCGFPRDEFLDVTEGVLQPDQYAFAISASEAAVKLIVKPAPNDPTAGDRWSLLLSSAIELEELTFGITLPVGTTFGEAQVIGCEPGNAQLPANNKCDNPGSSLTPQADRSASWTVGPHPSLPKSGSQDVIYFHLKGALPSSLGGVTVNRLSEPVVLGAIEIPGSNGIAPTLFIEGAVEVIGGPAFIESELGPIDISEIAPMVAGGLLLSDADGDGIGDDDDKCVFAYDPTNTDRGGVLLEIPDGVGDVCQCGEAHGPAVPVEAGGGVVDNSDVELLQDLLTGESTDVERALRCSVSGDNTCNIKDAVVLELATDGPSTPMGPGVLPKCRRAGMLPPVMELADTPPALYHSPGDTGLDPDGLVPAFPNTGPRTVFLYLDPGRHPQATAGSSATRARASSQAMATSSAVCIFGFG